MTSRVKFFITTLSAIALATAPVLAQFNGLSGIFALNGQNFGLASTGFTIISGGTGYAPGDTISLTCPAIGAANKTLGTVTVGSVSSGVITSVAITTSGIYTSLPSTGDASAINGICSFIQASTSGSGSGAVISILLAFNGAPNTTTYVGPLQPGYSTTTGLGSAANLNLTGSSNSMEVSSPAVSPVTYGYATIIGKNAGLNFNASAFESTIIGYGAGGSGWCGYPNADGLYMSPQCTSGGTGLTGHEDTYIGWFAGTQATTASYQTAVGVNAMGHDVSGILSTAVGNDAMRNELNASWSTGIGGNALRNVSGINNTAVGAYAFANLNMTTLIDGALASHHDMIGVGYNAGNSPNVSSTAYGDVFVGNNTGTSITTASNLVGVGNNTLQGITTSSYILAAGTNADQYGTGGSIVALGTNAFPGSSFSGQADTGTGTNVGVAVTSGNFLSLYGYNNGVAITTGSNDSLFGAGVGPTLTTGSGDILIGTGPVTDVFQGNVSNMLNIGGIIYQNLTTTASPTVAGGTSPSIDSYANNKSGQVTFGTGTVTSGTITFAGGGYAFWNHCRVTPHSTVASFAYSYTKAVITVTGASITSLMVDYDCDGY